MRRGGAFVIFCPSSIVDSEKQKNCALPQTFPPYLKPLSFYLIFFKIIPAEPRGPWLLVYIYFRKVILKKSLKIDFFYLYMTFIQKALIQIGENIYILKQERIIFQMP